MAKNLTFLGGTSKIKKMKENFDIFGPMNGTAKNLALNLLQFFYRIVLKNIASFPLSAYLLQG